MISQIERTATTNFEFLILDWDLKEKYYDRAKYIEDFYVKGEFKKTIEQEEKFEKDLIEQKKILSGINETIDKSPKEEALIRLEFLFNALKNISIQNGQKVESDFTNPLPENSYNTNERKLIYVQTADNSDGKWDVYSKSEKIGDATADVSNNPLDFQPNSEFLRRQADCRIREYMTTSGVPFNVEWSELAYRPNNKQHPWFRDQEVHEVLKKSGYKKNTEINGNEWWNVSLETAKKAIQAVKENREYIDGPQNNNEKIILRPEQLEAVSRTKKVFENKKKMLWNAKMRFGKTLTAYQLVKEENYKSVLILTHRPVVSDSWFKDFYKLEMNDSGYIYSSKSIGPNIKKLISNNKKFVYFASMQDLRGSSIVGGNQGDKNKEIFSHKWDLIIFDEAHEGTQTELAKRVESGLEKKETKILELSGTPFNILDQYTNDQVFTWDYVMEQEAKLRWNVENPNKMNPYESLPKVNMYTFEMIDKEKYEDDSKSFNFKEFFRVDDNGNFVHESDVNNFLNEITKNAKTNYPYSTEEYRNELRHSLWLLPGVAEAKALKKLMDKHPIFKSEYNVINVVDHDDNDVISNDDPDLERVRKAISDKPWETKTITLTVRKLTTGVNVKEWTAVMFLNNTTSPMNYLQAAFRAQTPYSDKVQGKKTNSYVFDFAPDRALTVMAESATINSGVGKKNTPEQKKRMSKLLNFLPILGIEGNSMKKYSMDRMLTQLKKVYAEKAVRTGFDDDSIYSDELLTIDPKAAEMFEKLRGIIGKTGASKKPKKVDVNKNGLSDEENNRAEEAKKKKKNQRTPEEQEALDKQKEAKKQRRNAISILRGISIRIPLMIFGMDIDISQDVDINTFINKIDDISWKEFMPAGVTKEMFLEQSKYYDPEVFIEAGRIIRRRAKSYDELTYTERSEKIALLHGTFKNPDKETILTPWSVVNRQLASTIGGLSFYNEEFSDMTIDGNSALNWVKKDVTDDIFKDNGHVIEINSKTGLYPLYAANSFFYKKQMEFINRNAGQISKNDEEKIIRSILKNNIYVIAKTPMARTITKRTLVGYKNWNVNIKYVKDITNRIKNDKQSVIKEIQKEFGIMKFDAVVGNPPYQQDIEGRGDQPSIYNYFLDLGYSIGTRVSMIHPARFLFNAGNTPKKWNNKMLNDPHLKIEYFEQDSSVIFPNTDIKGGVAISYRDENKNYGPIGFFTPYPEVKSILNKVNQLKEKSISDIFYSNTSYKYDSLLYEENPYLKKRVSGGSVRYLSSSVLKNFREVLHTEKPNDDYKYASIIGRLNNERVIRYMREDYLVPPENYKRYKVFVAASNGTGKLGEKLSKPLVGKPNFGATETFISLGSFSEKEDADNLLKYLETRFARVMLGTVKITQSNKSKDVWKNVPLVNFKNDGDIDWSQTIDGIDCQLFKIFNLSNDEIKFIEDNADKM